MGRSKFVRLRRITFLIPLLVLTAARAHALDVGHCDTPEGLSARIKAEGHKIVAQMDRVGISLKRGGVRHDVAQFVTAKPDLTRWYLIGGDEPLAKRSSKMCVVLAGHNLEVNDYRKDAPPTVTSYTFDTAKALAECDRLSETFAVGENTGIRCNEFNEGVRILGKTFHERIALQGVTDKNTLMAILANPDAAKQAPSTGKHNFHTLAIAPAGATLISGRGDNFSFSAWALSVLDRAEATQQKTN